MEFYDTCSGKVLHRIEVVEFQRDKGYIVQDKEIRCGLLPGGTSKGRNLSKYASEELGWKLDSSVLICKRVFGKEFLLDIPRDKAKELHNLASRNKIRLYTGWTWLLQKMAETKKEDLVGFLLLGDCLYRGDIHQGILQQCSNMNYFVFDEAEGIKLDFLKSSLWIIDEKEE